MRDPNNPCLFCNTDNKEYIFENDLAFATFDSYPVSIHHCLIILNNILTTQQNELFIYIKKKLQIKVSDINSLDIEAFKALI